MKKACCANYSNDIGTYYVVIVMCSLIHFSPYLAAREFGFPCAKVNITCVSIVKS